jgi:uncharacterized protein YjiS (DUF1127 family)
MRAAARRRLSRNANPKTPEEMNMKANLSAIPAKRSTASLVEHVPRRGDAAFVEPLPSLSRVFSLLLLWQERVHTRRQLRELDEHALHDIGLSRGEALTEAEKPFWR